MLIPLFCEGPCKPGLHRDDSMLLFPSHTTMGDLSPPDYFLSFKNTFYTFHISPLAGIFKFWRMVTIISPQDTLLPTGQRERGPMLSVSLIDPCGDSLSSTIANLKRNLGMRLSSRLSVDPTSASASKRHVPVFFLQAWDTLSRWVFIFFGVASVCSRVEVGPFFPLTWLCCCPRELLPFLPLHHHYCASISFLFFCSYLTLASFIKTITLTVKRSVCVQPRREDAFDLNCPPERGHWLLPYTLSYSISHLICDGYIIILILCICRIQDSETWSHFFKIT